MKYDNTFFSSGEISRHEQKCLRLLNYTINTRTSYNLLSYFYENGLNAALTDSLHLASLQLLDFFVSDIRSLDFSELEVALACLTFTYEIYTGEEEQKKIKRMLWDVYHIKTDLYMNCLFVLKR